MAVKSLKRLPVYAWVPPIYDPVYKIEIEKSNGTKYDITERIFHGTYTYGITETIGNFNFTFDNSDQFYSNLIDAYDKVNIYLDYADTATTLRFVGLIEKRSFQNNQMRITGRSSALRILGITVTQTYTNQYTHTILENLISTYANGVISPANIDTTEATDTQVSVSWYQKPFWECIQELCIRSGYDAFINQAFEMDYFVSGSKTNTTEAVVHEHNIINTGDFTPDLSVVRNRIIVYGAEVEGMQIIWTAEDDNSIASYDAKEEIIKDTTIRTVSQAQSRSEYELSLLKNPPIIGEVTSLGLPTISPGEKVRISDPQNGLNPNYYAIQKYEHIFSNDEPMQTILTVQREVSTIPKILKKRITFEQESIQKENPNEMRYSWLFTFDSDSGTHNNTEITSGRLKLDNNETSGIWTTELNSISENVTAVELRAAGDALPGTTYEISTNNGLTYEAISGLNSAQTLSTPGKNLKLKIMLNAANTQLNSLMLLYKTE